MAPTDALDEQPVHKILKAARLCGHVGQTVVIYQRDDGSIFCNYQENNGCNEKTDACRLRDARTEHGRA